MAAIPKSVKVSVWSMYIGANKAEGQCYVCNRTIHITDFDVGHNIARAKGGKDQISNLRPICRTCNSSMGKQSIEAFKAKFYGKAKETTAKTATTPKPIPAPTTKPVPLIPHSFYGSVTIGGKEAPLGTMVSAKVNRVESGNVTTWEVGKYGWGEGAPLEGKDNLLVQGKHISNGDPIEFYINGVKADQTSTFQSMVWTELNLTVASAPFQPNGAL